MRHLIAVSLVALIPMTAISAPVHVLDMTTLTPAFPVEDALADLGERVQVSQPDVAQAQALEDVDVLLIDGGANLERLGLGAGGLQEFVRRGGGILVAGLPDALPRTNALWELLGEAAPADVPAADLFPSEAGNWMWIPPQQGETPDHIRYIRKVIEVTKPVKRAFIRCTVDNLYWVYLNGEEVGYHWSWFDNELWDIADKLKQGKNVVAFKGRNVDGPGGFFAQVGIEYEDGTRELIVSDKSWKFHIPEEEGWSSLEFDDSGWGTATSVTPMASKRVLPDTATKTEGDLALDASHPILNAIANRFGTEHFLRGVIPREGAAVIARVGDHPVMLASSFGEGRVVLIDAVTQPGGIGVGDMSDDLLATSILWLAGRADGLSIAEVAYPPAELTRADPCSLGFTLKTPQARVSCVLTATLTRDGQPLGDEWRFNLGPGIEPQTEERSVELRGYQAEGAYELSLTARDEQGDIIFHRDATTEVKNPVNLTLSVPANRYVTAEGARIDFQGAVEGEFPAGSVTTAKIIGPRGEELTALEGTPAEEGIVWSYEVPDLAEGEYQLVTQVTGKDGKIIDTSRLNFYVVPRLDLDDFFCTTMRMSKLTVLNKQAVEREIDDIIAHGFNTLTFSARRLGAAPGSPYDYAEDYAQRRGMAITYSFQGSFSLLRRDALPEVSVFSPEYKEALRPRIEKAIETCRLVPRLLNVQGYMDEPFQVSGKTFDDRPPARAEFKRRYGIEMPTREEAMKDPALWLKYVDFWSDGFAAGWRQSYAMVKEMYPDFWVELTHDSHNTFGAAGRDFKGSWAVDDVYHWGAPFDSVNYDIYPYWSIDFRLGKFREHPLPRMAGVHMAFAEMRNLAYTYDKKLGFWLESVATGGGNKNPNIGDIYWSPRELTYTALAAGCDYLNTFWGIPQNDRWWQTYGETMNEVKQVAPLLTRSRVPRARAAFLFPRTQHVLLQEEYWNVMVGLEAFRQAYGELDCIHEDQLAEGTLDEYRVLVLFDIHLMKRASAEIIREWCKAGGIIIADEVPSMDELKQPLGVFEPVFGLAGTGEVREGPFEMEGGHKLWGMRSYVADGAEERGARVGDAPLAFEHDLGQGTAWLLNYPVKDCYLDALVRGNENRDADLILGTIDDCLREGPPPNVSSSNPWIEAALRQTADGVTLVLLINHESEDALTRVEVRGAPDGGIVRDLITGERLPHGAAYAMDLRCPWGTTRLLGIFPSDPSGTEIRDLPATGKRGERVDYAVRVGGAGTRGNYLLEITVTGPDGERREAFCARTCTRHGTCARSIRLPINAEEGTWTIGARSLWDGSEARATFTVQG